MNQKEYHDQEMRRYSRQLRELEATPAREQAEEAAQLLEHWQTDEGVKWFTSQADWILDGSYGYAEQYKARQILRMSKRANKAAQLSQMTAALACTVKGATARALWHKLTPEQQARLTAAMNDLISDATDALNEEEAETAA